MANEPTSRIAELGKEVTRLNHLIEIGFAGSPPPIPMTVFLDRLARSESEREDLLGANGRLETENQRLREDLDWLEAYLKAAPDGPWGCVLIENGTALACGLDYRPDPSEYDGDSFHAPTIREAIDKARKRQ